MSRTHLIGVLALLVFVLSALLLRELGSRASYVQESGGDVKLRAPEGAEAEVSATGTAHTDAAAPGEARAGERAAAAADPVTRFREALEARVREQTGQATADLEPDALLAALPGLTAHDFAGVAAQQGTYELREGVLTFRPTAGEERASGRALTREGYATLLARVAKRMAHPRDTTFDIDRLVGLLATPQGEFW